MTIKNNKALFTSTFILTCALFFAAFKNISLFADGGNWLFESLRTKNLYFDHGFKRFSDLVVQLPFVALLKFFGSEFFPSFYRTIWGLCYLLHPVVSLLFCFSILSRENNKSLIYFPLFGVSACLIPTIIFSVGVAPTTLSISWVAWSLIVSEKNQV